MAIDHKELIQRCALLHHDLMATGLIATGQKMHEVVRSIGFEVADEREKADKASAKARRKEILDRLKQQRKDGTAAILNADPERIRREAEASVALGE
jgi:hypothetical protein